MTTNLAEDTNSILKGTRHFPINSVVKETYYRMGTLFTEMRKQFEAMINGGHTWCKTFIDSMEKNQNKSSSMLVHGFTQMDQTFTVAEMVNPHERVVTGTYLVHLHQRWCYFGRFQALQFSCAHAIATVACCCSDSMNYVDEIYKLETILKIFTSNLNVFFNVWMIEVAT